MAGWNNDWDEDEFLDGLNEGHGEDDVQQGAAANGFTRHSLTVGEAWTLYRNRYMAPPDMRCPGTWRLSAGGIPIPPVPQGARRRREIAAHFYNVLTDA